LLPLASLFSRAHPPHFAPIPIECATFPAANLVDFSGIYALFTRIEAPGAALALTFTLAQGIGLLDSVGQAQPRL
jgi:hypothetical protein